MRLYKRNVYMGYGMIRLWQNGLEHLRRASSAGRVAVVVDKEQQRWDEESSRHGAAHAVDKMTSLSPAGTPIAHRRRAC